MAPIAAAKLLATAITASRRQDVKTVRGEDLRRCRKAEQLEATRAIDGA